MLFEDLLILGKKKIERLFPSQHREQKQEFLAQTQELKSSVNRASNSLGNNSASAIANQATRTRKIIEFHLAKALEKQELMLVYQPQLDLKTGQISGVEALLRWQNKFLGLVSPAHFINLAEDNGLIEPIGEWVLENAIAQSLVWQKAGLSQFPVSVNVSPIQLRNPQFIDKTKTILESTGLAPHLLDLEVTESRLMEDIASVHDNLEALQELGVQISLDDFGTGYSSLAYLKNFPFHRLKIDQSFVSNLKHSPKDGALISAIISVGNIFDMQIIAEGAEFVEQVQLLVGLGCDHVQGYWLSHPLTATETENFLLNYEQSNQRKEIYQMMHKDRSKSPLYLIA